MSRNARLVTNKQLTVSELTAGMRAIGVANNIPSFCFTGKSGRIGGTTNSAMSGRSIEHIKALTGHASESSLQAYNRADSIHSKGIHRQMAPLPACVGSTRGVNRFMDPPVISIADLKRSLDQSTVVKVAHSRHFKQQAVKR